MGRSLIDWRWVAKTLPQEEVDKILMSNDLSTPNLPDPDQIIRKFEERDDVPSALTKDFLSPQALEAGRKLAKRVFDL